LATTTGSVIRPLISSAQAPLALAGDLFDNHCDVCVRAAVQLWWHTYSEAWHHFLVTYEPEYDECVAWLDDKEVDEHA